MKDFIVKFNTWDYAGCEDFVIERVKATTSFEAEALALYKHVEMYGYQMTYLIEVEEA